jgi:hypothetical protein
MIVGSGRCRDAICRSRDTRWRLHQRVAGGHNRSAFVTNGGGARILWDNQCQVGRIGL